MEGGGEWEWEVNNNKYGIEKLGVGRCNSPTFAVLVSHAIKPCEMSLSSTYSIIIN